MNSLVLGLIPALSLRKWTPQAIVLVKPGIAPYAIMALTLFVVFRQCFILKTATGDFLPNTYQAEPFHFFNPELLKATFGFQYGVFLYAPLLLFSLGGAYFFPDKLKRWILPLLFLFVLYVYASWWFWPICTRASIDFYVIPAILLATLFNRLQGKPAKIIFTLFSVALCFYYQLKLLQFNRGILDKNYTYAKLYFDNFFKVNAIQQFVVPPYTILNSVSMTNGFEDSGYTGSRSDSIVLSGKHSVCLDVNTEYGAELSTIVPDLFFDQGIAKIRYTVHVMALQELREFQVYMNFIDNEGKQTLSIPFYVKRDVLNQETWLKMEFGHEFNQMELAQLKDNSVQVFIWNSGKKSRLYVDDVKLEFFLCDRSAEIVP
jgi:hypothetical protein